MESLSVNGDHEPAKDSTQKEYRELLQLYIPLYTTRLVHIADIPFGIRDRIHSPEDVVAVLQEYFKDKDREEFLVIFLDTANTVIGIAQTSIGGLAASIVEPRTVFKAAIMGNAAALILVHNHPSGNLEPSREDIRITRQLIECGKMMGIPIHDHLIIAGRAFTSLAECGLID